MFVFELEWWEEESLGKHNNYIIDKAVTFKLPVPFIKANETVYVLLTYDVENSCWGSANSAVEEFSDTFILPLIVLSDVIQRMDDLTATITRIHRCILQPQGGFTHYTSITVNIKQPITSGTV